MPVVGQHDAQRWHSAREEGKEVALGLLLLPRCWGNGAPLWPSLCSPSRPIVGRRPIVVRAPHCYLSLTHTHTGAMLRYLIVRVPLYILPNGE